MASNPNLDAKLHQGYDPSIEHMQQGRLYGSVSYGQEHQTDVPILSQILDGFAGALRNVFDGASNFFGGNHSNVVNNVNLPQLDRGNAPSIEAGGNNVDTLGGLGNEVAEPNPTLSGLGNSAPLPIADFVAHAINNIAPESITGSQSNNPPITIIDFPPVNPPVNPVGPTAPVLATPPVTGSEDHPTLLNIGLTSDPSVVTTVMIGNVPNGAILTAGVDNHDGTWTLTPAQLIGLAMNLPMNESGNFNLTVTASSTENGITLTDNHTVAVIVHGIADVPNLAVQLASGNEDTAIALNISASLTDTDGSENLSIVIGNIPNGAMLSTGVDNHNGTWTLTPAQLIGLNFIPPSHVSGDFNLSVTAISSEDNTSASANAVLPVTVTGVVHTPILSTAPAMGNEDTAIALSINAMPAVNDGETLSITIGNVPNGATLSAGIDNHDGTWTLTSAQLAGLTITPPHNSDNDFTLSVTATSSENSTTSSVYADLAVTVNGVADAPTLSTSPVSGNENTAIALTISAALTDTDGSETLSIDIGNVPVGAMLSAGLYTGNGHWSLTAAQLVGLTITPPQNFEGPINLQITAISTEDNGDTASVTSSTTVMVHPVATPPVLTIGVADGNEDTLIALNISVALHGSESVSFLISGVPNGASLSAGIDNHNGSWTLTEAQPANLTILPPHNSDVDFGLTVTATATASDGSNAVTVSPLNVVVHAVADTPTVLAANVSGVIDTHVAMNISGALTDTDGSESITYVIAGVPDGFSFNHGSNDGNNKWTFTPADIVGLTLTSPYHFQGTLNLTAYSVSHEAENGSVALSAGDPFSVTIGDPALGVNLNLGLGLGVAGIGLGTGVGIGVTVPNILDPAGIVMMEDSPLLLNGLTGLVTGLLTPLQQLSLGSIIISGLPAGVSLSDGIDLHNGSYQLSLSQLSNLYLIAPPNSDQDFTLSVDAKLLSLLSISLATTVVHVIGVADAPLLTVDPVTVNEGASIPLHITSALTDTDGSETLSITLQDLPTGFVPNIGINNADGTWTIPVAQLSSLALVAPAHWSGDATYTVVATSTEREGDSTNTVVTGHIHVNPVADAPIVTPPAEHSNEGQAVSLNLGISLADTDGSEHLSAIIIGGVQSGFSLTHATDNHDGTWSVNPSDIGNVQLITPAYWSGDAHLTVTATSQESTSGAQISATANLAVHVEAHADTPTLTVQNVTGDNGSPIALNIHSGLVDTDGSEHLSVVITGIPQGMDLSAGLHNADNSWTLSQNDLSHLTVTAGSNFTGDMHLTATAVAQEQSNGDTASISQNFTVHVDAAANLDHAFVTPAN